MIFLWAKATGHSFPAACPSHSVGSDKSGLPARIDPFLFILVAMAPLLRPGGKFLRPAAEDYFFPQRDRLPPFPKRLSFGEALFFQKMTRPYLIAFLTFLHRERFFHAQGKNEIFA